MSTDGRIISACGALHRLDELSGPVRLEGESGVLDAYLYGVSKMAEMSMEMDNLLEAERLHRLQTKMERAADTNERIEIRRSDALRLSALLSAYHGRLLERGDVCGAEAVENATAALDEKLNAAPSETEQDG